MATVTRDQGHQGLDIAIIGLDAGENAVVAFNHPINGRVKWDMGGVSWTVAPRISSDTIEVTVEHSLTPDGDYWAPDPDSPFSKAVEGKEFSRIERIRYANAGSAAVDVVVSSPAAFSVETA